MHRRIVFLSFSAFPILAFSIPNSGQRPPVVCMKILKYESLIERSFDLTPRRQRRLRAMVARGSKEGQDVILQ